MTTIGLIAGSFKPFHKGHYALVRMASQENDEVHLFVSLSDRKRKGEFPVVGSDMERIWRDVLEPILPGNVAVTYGGSPVGNVYEELGLANEAQSQDTFTIYADPQDLSQNFPEKSLNKYAGYLWTNGQINLSPIERTQTAGVSGGKMRQYLASGDKQSFLANVPEGADGEAMWRILSRSVTGESLLREFITRAIRTS